MRKSCALILAGLLSVALLSCTAEPNMSSGAFSGESSSPSAGADSSSEASTAEPEQNPAEEIKGYSLEEAGLAISTDRVFTDPNTGRDAIWEIWHTETETQEWLSVKRGDYHGNLTFVVVNTTESVIDAAPHLMFLLQCYRSDELADGTAVKVQGAEIPVEEIRARKICEKGKYTVCDLTGYVLPEGFKAQMEEQKKEGTDNYDFDWTLDLYAYFSKTLPDLIVKERASGA